MSQPIIVSNCINYKESEKSEPCKIKMYSGFCTGKFTIIPDGCTELIFTWKEGNTSYILNINKEVKTLQLQDCYVNGVRIYPGYKFSLTDIQLQKLTEELSEISDENDRELYIGEHLNNEIEKSELHSLTDFMINQIIRTKGSTTVGDLAAQLGYSERHINNLFKERMGFGPKDFCRLIRFQSALEEVSKNPARNNSEFIEGLSYSDQAHFQREFKTFTGMTPKKFIMEYFINKKEGAVALKTEKY